MKHCFRGIRLALISGLFAFTCASSAQSEIGFDLEQTLARLVQVGAFDEARQLLDESAHDQADVLVLNGRIAKVQGQLQDAIAQFKQALSLAPDYIVAKRELAHTLLLAQNYDAAEYHFNGLLRVDRNAEMRRGYRGYLDVIHQNKPIGFSGFLSFLPSTNINRGTTNDVFDTVVGDLIIDAGSQADSGVGVQLGVSGFFRHRASETSRYVLNWSLSGTRYKEHLYNSTLATVAASNERLTPLGNVTLGTYYRKTWRNDDAENAAYGLHFALNHKLGDRSDAKFSMGYELRDYAVQNYLDSRITHGSINVGYQIDPSTVIRGGLGAEFNRVPEATHLQHNAYKAFMGITKSWHTGLQTSFGLEVGEKKFTGDYPLATYARQDTYSKINMSLQDARINFLGFSPRLACSYVLNSSNVAFFDYRAADCQATVSKQF